MRKAGYTIINKKRNGGRPAKCASCGGIGSFRVTFTDCWGKLTVTLCMDCAAKRYEELNLQSRFDVPDRI